MSSPMARGSGSPSGFAWTRLKTTKSRAASSGLVSPAVSSAMRCASYSHGSAAPDSISAARAAWASRAEIRLSMSDCLSGVSAISSNPGPP